MTTAFQPNAFQNDAFQIDIGGDGGNISAPRKKRWLVDNVTEEESKRFFSEYEKIIEELPDNAPEIVSAIDPFIEPISQEEWDRRLKARYIVDVPPAPERIDFMALLMNELARNRFMRALERIKLRILAANLKRRQEEEEFFILMMAT